MAAIIVVSVVYALCVTLFVACRLAAMVLRRHVGWPKAGTPWPIALSKEKSRRRSSVFADSEDEGDRGEDRRHGSAQLPMETQLPEVLEADRMHLRACELTYYPTGDAAKPLLDHVTLEVRPGELVAVMGTSGSGKTTLLDLITARRTYGQWKGNLYLNDVAITTRNAAKMRQAISYVRQLGGGYLSRLTVFDNMMYAALLRLPIEVSLESRKTLVLKLLEELNLLHRATAIVGSDDSYSSTGPHISGGQKRRLSVAMELITNPVIMVLDEPTSGLDATACLQLLEWLHTFCATGRTVVMSIHQPRAEVFEMFDNLIIIDDGRVVATGTPQQVGRTFQRCAEQHSVATREQNVADMVMDLLSMRSRSVHSLVLWDRATFDRIAATACISASATTSAMLLALGLGAVVEYFRLPAAAHTTLCVGIWAAFGILSGFYIPMDEAPSFIRWLFYVSPYFYSFTASIRVLLEGIAVECSSFALSSVTACILLTPDGYLHTRGYADVHVGLHLWLQMLVWVVIFLFFYLFSSGSFPRFVERTIRSMKTRWRRTNSSVSRLNTVGSQSPNGSHFALLGRGTPSSGDRGSAISPSLSLDSADEGARSSMFSRQSSTSALLENPFDQSDTTPTYRQRSFGARFGTVRRSGSLPPLRLEPVLEEHVGEEVTEV